MSRMIIVVRDRRLGALTSMVEGCGIMIVPSFAKEELSSSEGWPRRSE
jgi:hypothetical protein